jgi:hypothetical protein
MQNSDQIKAAEVADEDDESLGDVARKLADAFITIEKYSSFIPERYSTQIVRAIRDLASETVQKCGPDTLAAVLPALLEWVAIGEEGCE